MRKSSFDPEPQAYWDTIEEQDQADADAGFFLDEEAHGRIEDQDWDDEEPRECGTCGQLREPDWVEKHECYSQWTGDLVGQFVEMNMLRGIALVVKHHSPAQDRVIAVMVGDSRLHDLEVTEVTVIPRERFCGQCGATGCTHDGLDRT